ncbi:GGDEF domain-containing protein [Sporomusa silvacetica]|nr:GGDEF domain-containing protein [Sporomusa silvacetica]
MIQILLAGAIFAIASTIFFIHQNHALCRRIKTYQKLAQELSHQRDFDMLSGIKNRNAFIRFAQQVEKRGDNVSVMVCDIDGLKIINDTLGHMAGDKIIRKSAEILNEACPSNANIFRTGGDEYVVIIQEVLEEQELMKLRQSIKIMIASYNATHPSIPLSISIGFASTSANISEFWEVSKEADYNMYQEKRACQEKVYNNLRTALIE